MARRGPDDFRGDAAAVAQDDLDPRARLRVAVVGARHEIDLRTTGGLYNRFMYLGQHIDHEADSQPSANATGDDGNTASGLNGVVASDEDGVVFPAMLSGTNAVIPVTYTLYDYDPFGANVPIVRLRGWIDWNQDGDFLDAGEAVIDYTAGTDLENEDAWTGPRTFTHNATIAIPVSASGSYFMRVRLGPNTNPTNNTAAYGEVEDHQFTITSLGSLSGVVGVDTNGDGIADLFESGVTLTLRDSSGNVVLVGGNPVTTTTDANGAYTFTGLVPGSYQVLKTPLGTYVPYSDLDGGDPNLIGSNTNIVVTGGAENTGNNFLEILQKCPDTWVEWQAKWNTDLGGQTGVTQNPDGDRYDNLVEYAFCLPPHLGIRKPFCLNPSVSVSGAIDGTYTRTAIGGGQDVTYVLEWTNSLANPTVWSGSKVLLDTDPALVIVNDGQGGETVTISDLEAFTGLAAGSGFVRIRVDLNDGTTVASDATDVLGWKQTDFPVCGSTYSNPFLECAIYTGTVASATGQTLTFTDSGEGFDLDTLLSPGVAYYLEVETGALAGHRFDVTSAGVGTLTLQPDADAVSYLPPFNTVANLDPATLAGSRIALHRAKTLDMLFPPSGFGASADPLTADQVQLFVGGQWRIFWLSIAGGPAAWIDTNGGGLAGGNVIPPGRGMFFNNRNAATGLLAFGEVREHSFANPLAAGNNLAGGGYPVGQSPVGANSRQLNRVDGFFGSRDFKTADSVFRWRGDTNSVLTGYDTYFLLYNVSPAAEKWVLQNDATRASQNGALIFEGDRSVFQRVAGGVVGYRIPAPWAPGEATPPPTP